MSNYVEYNDTIAVHPGYYIKEIVDDSGLTQEDFAKRLGTTPKNLSLLVRGEQSISIDIAMKLSRMLGTSIYYWLNLQNAYDTRIAEFKSAEELTEERRVFEYLEYKYFRENYHLPDLPRQKDEQIKCVREFLKVATLSVLTQKDMAVSFRSAKELTEANTVKANAMVQIAVNQALGEQVPRFNKKKYEEAVQYALSLTENHTGFYNQIQTVFRETGVIFVILPNISGSKTNGATKKIGNHVLLMVNDRRLNADTFWFTLFHEIGHIINGDYGISFEGENSEKEDVADRYAEDCLIPPEEYRKFVEKKKFDLQTIREFANEIGRDPGIVLGRLQKDGIVGYDDWSMKTLRHKYKVKVNG